MNRDPIVYVISEPSVPKRAVGKMIDLSPLYEHAKDIRFLVTRGQYPTFADDGLFRQIKAGLKDFDPELDYLVWAGGDALAAVTTGIALADMNVKQFVWLRHERVRLPDGTRDPTQGHYVPVNVRLDGPSHV